MSLRSVLSVNARTLTDNEQRIVDVLLADPAESSTWPAAEIAKRAGVHESSVTRLAQKLAYSGYRELREDLMSEVAGYEPPPTREHIRDSAGYDLESFVHDENADLQRLVRHVPQASIDAIARDLTAARRVYFHGNWFAKSLMEMLDRRLRRLGIDVVVLTGEGRQLAEQLVWWDERDVVFVFALRNMPPAGHGLLREAQRLGSTTVVLTDVLGMVMGVTPTHVVTAPRGENSENFRTMMVPLALCYAINQAVYHCATERADASLRRVIELDRILSQDL